MDHESHTHTQPRLLNTIPAEDRLRREWRDFNEESIHTLGIKWNPERDEFSFHVPDTGSFENEEVTKRMMLSIISRLYDPAGWLSPITVAAKISLQDLWLAKLSWDEEIPAEMLTRWRKFCNSLSNVGMIRVPRWLRVFKYSSYELHGFADASQRAYAAVIYLREKREMITEQRLYWLPRQKWHRLVREIYSKTGTVRGGASGEAYASSTWCYECWR